MQNKKVKIFFHIFFSFADYFMKAYTMYRKGEMILAVSRFAADEEFTIAYKNKLHSLVSTAYDCFCRRELSSLSYETDAFMSDKSECFLFEIEQLINKNLFDSVVHYDCCGKEYWELSDGDADMCICLYTDKSKTHIKIDCFD